MKILIAPDKFKHSLTSLEACMAIKEGILKATANADCELIPLADGGDGLSEIVEYYTGAKPQKAMVSDPLFRPIDSYFLVSDDGETAFIEMAKASGLVLLKPEERNCMNTTTFGTGELIKKAIELKVKKIILGIGGSATNDCGIGMATALGFRFLDKNGAELSPIGKNLILIEHIDASQIINLNNIQFEIACDVKNPLTGKNGATKVYARQKGASDEEIEYLENGMLHFSKVIKNNLGKDVDSLEGAGAAGGLGAACVAFLNGELKSGIDLILQLSKAENAIKDADWVITGEGKLDQQSLSGKVISGLSDLCNKYNKSLIVFCGSLGLTEAELLQNGIKAAYPINIKAKNLEDSIRNAFSLLKDTAYQFSNENLLQ